MTDVWTKPTDCDLCGAKGQPVSYRLVEWLEALPGMRFEHIPRCDDRAACRVRVEAAGGTWPVRERAA